MDQSKSWFFNDDQICINNDEIDFLLPQYEDIELP